MVLIQPHDIKGVADDDTMNAAALNFYKTLRKEGTQKSVVPFMQTRAELYEYLNYHAYEQKLDALFAEKK